MTSEIPVKNLFYLYLYAWDKYNEGRSFEYNSEKISNLPNLASKVLINSANRIIKKGLYKVYSTNNSELSFVKGKIDFKKSISNNLLKKGKLNCLIDELSLDSIPNKILKKTFEDLLNNKSLDKELKIEIRSLLKYFSQVKANYSASHYFSIFNFNNNNKYYKLPINLCELIKDYSLPTREHGNSLFKEAIDENSMGLVFEAFLRNFYRIEQNSYKVSSDRFPWDIEGDEYDLSLIQENITDITLRNSKRTLVIDAKFYRDPLVSNYGKFKIRQDNLRQIQSYLINLENNSGPDSMADGMLIYPQVRHQQPINAKINMRGHNIFIKSLNLDKDWQDIHNQLMNFIDY